MLKELVGMAEKFILIWLGSFDNNFKKCVLNNHYYQVYNN